VAKHCGRNSGKRAHNARVLRCNAAASPPGSAVPQAVSLASRQPPLSNDNSTQLPNLKQQLAFERQGWVVCHQQLSQQTMAELKLEIQRVTGGPGRLVAFQQRVRVLCPHLGSRAGPPPATEAQALKLLKEQVVGLG
jgi:hypothetical protein